MDDIRKGRCPLCRHPEVIASQPVDEVGGASAPMALQKDRSRFTGLPKAVHGALVTYTCRSCGYTQWFASQPAEVPIGAEHGTRLIVADGDDG